jgi:hypothetical protein
VGCSAKGVEKNVLTLHSQHVKVIVRSARSPCVLPIAWLELVCVRERFAASANGMLAGMDREHWLFVINLVLAQNARNTIARMD